jgi:hypothetical protein
MRTDLARPMPPPASRAVRPRVVTGALVVVLAAALAAASAAGCGVTRGDVLSLGAAGSGPPSDAGTAGSGSDVGPTDAGLPPGGLFFISPDGDDANPGTEAAPWRTFAHALPLLQPGLTLVLEDGVYAGATTGYLQVFCGTNAVDGTATRPITVRAQNERRAFLRGEGGGAPIELSACSNWVVEGLHAEGADVLGETGDEAGSVVVLTHGCSNVVLRRLVAARPNRYLTASVYVIAHAATNVLVEECEALDYHYYGFHAYDTTHTIFRRDYAHSRDVADITGGAPTSNVAQGDIGFLLTKSLNGVIENCVAEHVNDGFTIVGTRDMGGKVQPAHDQILGSVANDVTHAGVVLDSRCAGTRPCNKGDQIVSDPLLSNVVTRHGALGVSCQGGVRIQIENASIFDVTDAGIVFGQDTENLGLASSAFARASLVTAPGAAMGFRSTGQVDWSFSRCNSFGPAQSFAPRDAHVVNSTEIDPQLGGCLVDVPDASSLKTSGIGANIVFRFEDGQLTTTKLWDQATGQFPCGAVVAGLNDASRADVSCLSVGARLHVGAMGCAIP